MAGRSWSGLNSYSLVLRPSRLPVVGCTSHPTAIIVGPGPAGLTAADELSRRTDKSNFWDVDTEQEHHKGRG